MPKFEISKKQIDFYLENKSKLVDKYLNAFPQIIDPDAVRDLFTPIGYDRTNVSEFQNVCKLLTEDIFQEILRRNIGIVSKVIFAGGLPATGKSSHLRTFVQNEIIFDGTINDEDKLLGYIRKSMQLGYLVEIFIYSCEPKRAFESNLNRGFLFGRYVPISHYVKVAKSLNNREKLIRIHFQNQVKIFNFEHTKFEGKLKKFRPIIIKRDELETIAKGHKFRDKRTFKKVIA
ncbi:Zeta toxin [Aquiflexum balticum DSM 16537]|uniref:Zeta toxin n=1 Tax=Aquiflexum balticum DSM 16537 TaxID=758820 RepID=A0A1W2H5B1_9BACT|nr:Zeta toxin [Aquiflexum balticum DSM 16537]